jgi:hypothetical protein
MAKTDEGIFNVPRHGEMHLALGIVPIKHESKVSCSFPVGVDCVVLFQYAHEMLDVVLVDVLHAEIVDDECETDGAPVVLPVPRRDLALSIPGFVELLGEEVLRYDADLGEAVHPVLHFAEDITICVHLVAESVFVNDIRREQLQFHTEAFVSIHWCHEVEIFYVDHHELGVRHRDDTVEHYLDCEKIGCGCAAVIGVVDKISTHRDTGAVGVFFL